MAASPAMPESFKFNKHFVGVIERYPAIYDYTCEEYSNRNETEKAWHEVAFKINAPYEQCKLRWKSIRNSFIRHLRDTPPSGSGSNARKKPYYLHEYLQFLVPFTKSRKQSSNLNISNISDSTEIADDEFTEREVNDELQEINVTIHEIQAEDQAEDEDQNTLHPDLANQVGEVVKDLPDVGDLLVQRNSERKKKCTIEDVAASYFASRANENDNDGMLHFFKSLLPEIKKFSDRRKRQCKIEILKIVNNLAESED